MESARFRWADCHTAWRGSVRSPCWHCTFLVAAARIRNTLPLHVTSASLLTAFKLHLKLHLLCFSFPGLSPLWLLSGPCSVCCHLGHYKNFDLLIATVTKLSLRHSWHFLLKHKHTTSEHNYHIIFSHTSKYYLRYLYKLATVVFLHIDIELLRLYVQRLCR